MWVKERRSICRSMALLIFASFLLTVIPKDWSYRDRRDTNPVYSCLLQTREVGVDCMGGLLSGMSFRMAIESA